MKHACLAAALALATLSPARADEQVACTIDGCARVEINVSPFENANSFSVAEVWAVVDDILAVSGLAPNFLVVETEKVGNAAAIVIEDQRYLAFNPVWMRQFKENPQAKWQLYGVMAHEVGHHLQGHTITGTGSRPPTELEADEYAGFTLAALGANLDQSLSLWQTFGERGSATHPPRQQRLDAVSRGWQRRHGQAAPQPAAQPAPAQPPVIAGTTPPPPATNGEVCIRAALTLGQAQVCTSSVLDGQKGNTYGPANLFDHDARTAWVEGTSGNGHGQHITITFDSPVTVSALKIINGYAKSTKSYSDNARVADLFVQTSNAVEGTLTLRDTPDWQSYDINNVSGITWIRFRIESTYPGTRYTDTALSELWLE